MASWEFIIEVGGDSVADAWDQVGQIIRRMALKEGGEAPEHLDDWGELREIEETTLESFIIPDADWEDPLPYPGLIKPGHYTRNQLVALLREQQHNPAAIQFIADMLEK
mgnify:CR=1 FL=1